MQRAGNGSASGGWGNPLRQSRAIAQDATLDFPEHCIDRVRMVSPTNDSPYYSGTPQVKTSL